MSKRKSDDQMMSAKDALIKYKKSRCYKEIPDSAFSAELIILILQDMKPGSKNAWEFVKTIPEQYLNHKEVVEFICKKTDCEGFIYASDDLKNDKDYIDYLLNEEYDIFDKISDKLKDDEDICLRALEKRMCSLDEISTRLQKDQVFVLKTLELGLIPIFTIPDALLENKEFVQKAYVITSEIENVISERMKDVING